MQNTIFAEGNFNLLNNEKIVSNSFKTRFVQFYSFFYVLVQKCTLHCLFIGRQKLKPNSPFFFNRDKRCVLIFDALPCSDIDQVFTDVSETLISGGGDFLL